MRYVVYTWLVLGAGVAMSQAPFDLDTTYRTGITRQHVNSLLPLSDGRMVISGRMRFLEFPLNDKLLARLDVDGVLDPSFNTSNLGGGKLTPWNNIFYVATAQTVRRILADGTQDPSFIEMNMDPYFSSGQGGDYHVYPDGRVVMSGLHLLSDTVRGFEGFYSLVWFANTGYLDTTRIHRYCDNTIDFIHQLPDSAFLLSGWLNTYEGQPVGRIFRVQPGGALDPNFHTDIHWGQAYDLQVQDDGKIVAVGLFLVTGVTDTLHMIRLLPDGSLDSTFNNHLRSVYFDDGGYSAWVGIHPLPGVGWIVHGGFSSIDEEVRGGIALVDTAGQLLDTYFDGAGCGVYEYMGSPYASVESIIPDPLGSGYYICGAYHGYDDGTTNDTLQRFVSRLYGLDVGIAEPTPNVAFSLYPNPANEYVTLQRASTSKASPRTLEVRDAFGRVVRTERIPQAADPIRLDLREVPPGLYVVTLLGQGVSSASQRLIVQP